MAEGISLPPAAREVLFSQEEREMRLELARPQILSVCESETDAVALQATLACLLFQAFRKLGKFRRTPHKQQNSRANGA